MAIVRDKDKLKGASKKRGYAVTVKQDEIEFTKEPPKPQKEPVSDDELLKRMAVILEQNSALLKAIQQGGMATDVYRPKEWVCTVKRKNDFIESFKLKEVIN